MSFKALVTQNERGRSMVEILGVLAIIGVLSFGGIQGYKYAMDKHRANDIVNEVNMRATDIWHLYQDGEKELPDSPDEDAFPEYGEMTQTGFEILVTSHPPVAFRTWVNDVPSAVCQKVLQENLNDAIQGLKFVQVDNGGGLTRYTGDTAICGESGTMNQMVFTSFLDEDGGAVPEGGNGDVGDNCVDSEDCPQECGGAVCDKDTMTCKDGCTGTDKPICMRENATCVECLLNEDCQHKGRGWICDESNNTCTEMKKTCPKGTFRSQNGACIRCDDGSNFIVLHDGQGFPDTSDNVDGYTMCGECEASGTKRWSGDLTDNPSKGYCSFMCTEGYSYQSATEGCIPCNANVAHYIASDTVTKSQCLACEGHAWFEDFYRIWCQKVPECSEDEFIYNDFAGETRCSKCADNRNKSIELGWGRKSSISNFSQQTVDSCNACPKKDKNGNNTGRWVSGQRCMPVCDQPENADEQIEICKANPSSPDCTRKWQNKDGNCFSCSEMTTKSSVESDTTLKELCEKCGRRVNDKGYCVPSSTSACTLGKFLGADGTCHECNKNTGVNVESDELSGCTQNCKKDSADATSYSTLGSVNTRYVYNSVCNPVCKTGYWQHKNGDCILCNQHSTTPYMLTKETCSGACPDTPETKDSAREEYRDVWCGLKYCPELAGGVKQWHQRYGHCVSCNSTSVDHTHWDGAQSDIANYSEVARKYIEECVDCGNRAYFNTNYFCVLVNPGVSGVCNNIENDFYSRLNDTIKSAIIPYQNGDYNGVYYRDTEGYCRRCEDDASYNSTQKQCASCKNRRWEGNKCLKGLCEESKQFLNTNLTCVTCSNKNVSVDPKKENMCDRCDNRRMLTTGFEEQKNLAGLCVEECAPGMWQGKNGTCYFANHAQTVEIGTDMDSRNLCTTAGREVVELLDGSDNVVGYECKLP